MQTPDNDNSDFDKKKHKKTLFVKSVVANKPEMNIVNVWELNSYPGDMTIDFKLISIWNCQNTKDPFC